MSQVAATPTVTIVTTSGPRRRKNAHSSTTIRL